MRLIANLNPKIVKKISGHTGLAFFALSLYPLYFMSPVLFRGDRLLMASKRSDLGAYVWIVQWLDNMTVPFSKNQMIYAPSGTSFWNPVEIVNTIYWLYMWLLTRIISPIDAVNLGLLTAWVLSGLSVFFFMRWLKFSVLVSVFAGFLIEMMPWLREKLLTHPLYVFWCVPIFVLLLLFRFFRDQKFVSLVVLFGAVSALFFFDLYWFWFCADMVLISFLCNLKFLIKASRTWLRHQRVIVVLVTIVVPIVVYFFYAFIQQKNLDNPTYERPLAIAPVEFINYFNGSLSQLFTPPGHNLFHFGNPLIGEDRVNYVGIVVLLLSLFSLSVFRDRKSEIQRVVYTLWCLSFVFLLCTLPSTTTILNLRIGAVIDLFRYLNPGARTFVRMGILAESIICVLAGIGFGQLFAKVSKKMILLLFLIPIVIIDLNPLARQEVFTDYKNYSDVRFELAKTKNPVIFELFPEKDRWYFPEFYVDAPKVWTWKDFNDDNLEFRIQASRGDENFYHYLRSRKVTHVLVPAQADSGIKFWNKWGQIGSIDLGFPSQFYNKVAVADGVSPSNLFQLKELPKGNFCSACNEFFIEWSNVPPGFAGQVWDDSLGQNLYTDGASLSWVLKGKEPRFKVRTEGLVNRKFEIQITFVAAFGGNAPPQLLAIDVSQNRIIVKLAAGQERVATFVVSPDELVQIRSLLPCVKASVLEPGSTDDRELCFGVSDFKVKQLVP